MARQVPHTDSDTEMRRAIQRLRKDYDTGGGGSAVELLNNNASAVVIGTPVYSDGAGTFDKAQADAVGTAGVIGLVQPTEIASAVPGKVQVSGVLPATTAQWDAVTGDSGGLTPDAIYFLSKDTAGLLTTTAPTTASEFVGQVGRALSTTQMLIQLQQIVGL